jgi:hypothetical protein
LAFSGELPSLWCITGEKLTAEEWPCQRRI